MKYIALIFMCHTLAVAQISDDFSDGNFSQNPQWFGDSSHYEIDTLMRLHLNAPAQTTHSSLSLASNLLENTLWEMSLKMEFNPSSSNYFDWYILANDSVIETSENAYFIRVGGSNDEITLYKREEELNSKVITSTTGIVNSNPVEIRLKAERKLGGLFSIWVDLLNGNEWELLGTYTDSAEINSSYSGVNCTYTSTRSTLFYFDDFSINGSPFIDSIAPELISSEIMNTETILLAFNSNEFLELSNSQFRILPSEANPLNITKNENIIYLNFENDLPINNPFSLEISSIYDAAGNYMNDTVLDFYLHKHQAFDLIVNEIMIDPEPQVQLENVEYIELYNRANYPIKLENWLLVIDEKEYSLDSIRIPENDYLILYNKLEASFENLSSVYIPFTSLNNTAGYLGLFDQNNKVIHELQYHKSWYQNVNKENGGWSLEMIDNSNYCLGNNNWSACKNNRGGSPGIENSIVQDNPDTTAPFLENILISEEDEIELLWSENLYDSSLYYFNSYVFTNGISPQSIHHFMDKTSIQFFDDLQINKIYTIQMPTINDCNGNVGSLEQEFVLGVWPKVDELVLNEILFNPKPTGFDYVELYNKSAQYIDISKLLIGNYDTLLESIVNTEIISTNRQVIPPESYFVLCEDTTWLGLNYLRNSKAIYIEVDHLPSFPNQEGQVALSDLAYELIDKIKYTEEQHFPLLDSFDGVALERLNPLSTKWFSAASKDNYGTPGRMNSQFTYELSSKGNLTTTPEVFSPDNDGYKDFTLVKLELTKAARTSIHIYNKKGINVKTICAKELVTKNAEWIWNGLGEEELRLPIGIYIVVCETIDSTGKIEIYKKPLVISTY